MDQQKTLLDHLYHKAAKRLIPISVFFEVTFRCNLRCIHCYVVNSDKNELSLDEIKQILDQISDLGCLFLTLSGGEILVRDDFFEIAAYARKKGLCLRLFTNGTLIDRDNISRIKELMPIAVEVSLYGACSPVHDSITQVRGSFNRTLNAITLLLESGIKTILKCSVMKNNVSELDKLIRLANKLGAAFKFDATIYPKSNGDKTPLAYQIYGKDLRRLIALQGFKKLSEQELRKTIMPCQAGHTSCRISPTGDVFPCVLLPLKLGSLREKSFHEIWNSSPRLNELRSLKKIELPRCANCSLINYCSRCPGLSYLEEGDISLPSSYNCTVAKIRKEVFCDG